MKLKMQYVEPDRQQAEDRVFRPNTPGWHAFVQVTESGRIMLEIDCDGAPAFTVAIGEEQSVLVARHVLACQGESVTAPPSEDES